MTHLKPCPFCGSGDAGIIRVKTIFDHVLGFMVLCPNCGCTVGFNTDTEFTAFTDFSTEQEAIDAWNARESQPCYADEADHSRCKYSVNRGWVERTCKQKRLFNLMSRECDGEHYEWHGEEKPNYCPNCGAKVVE